MTELSAVVRIRISELVQIRQGGNPQLQGTWAHRRVAIDLARWLTSRFAVKVNEWADELLVTGRVELHAVRPTLQPYTIRVMQLPEVRQGIPEGYWSIFTEAADSLIWGRQFDALD